MIDERSRPYSYAGDDRVNQAITGRNIGGAGHTPQLWRQSDAVKRADTLTPVTLPLNIVIKHPF